MRVLAVAALLFAAGCPKGGPQQIGAQPSWRRDAADAKPVEVRSTPITYAPASEAAAYYNAPLVDPPSSELGDAVIAAVRDAAVELGTVVPVPDARLSRACAELAEIAPDDGRLPYRLLEFALHRNGIIEPTPHFIITGAEADDSVEEKVARLETIIREKLAAGATSRVGVGSARRDDGTDVVILALLGSGVSTQPIPRVLPPDGAFTLAGVIDAKFQDPEVMVTYDGGSTERLPLMAGSAGGFTSEFKCGGRTGRQQVEILANSAHGATVLANFPVWCGTTPPSSITIEHADDEVPATIAEVEQRVFALLNREREAVGLPPLQWDDRVAAVSRAHSEDMRRTRTVAHVLPSTGSAADRVRTAKIQTAVVLENVARAVGVGEAHYGLMNSPGHRANIMSRAVTHVGVGAVFGEETAGRREIYVTQVFVRVPPKLDPARAAELVHQRLVSVRPVGNNARLARIAQEFAAQLAAGKTREEAFPAVKRHFDGLGSVYERVSTAVVEAVDLESIDAASFFDDRRTDEVGVGVAKGRHPELGDDTMWVVVLLATRR